MANIDQYLQAIMNAVYGEDVRGSIHDAIDLINKVGEKTLTIGTAIVDPSSSIEGYYEDSVYINSQTDDVWKCDGTQWVLQGNMKGETGPQGVSPAVTVTTIAGGHAVTITDEDHPSGQTFPVMDGAGAAYIENDALILT